MQGRLQSRTSKEAVVEHSEKSTFIRGEVSVLLRKQSLSDTASHEGLMLDYEEALTRELSVPGSVAVPSRSSIRPRGVTAYYNTGAHFLWIGNRTRQLMGAHVEYFRGIRNPIGIKVGPRMGIDELVRILDGQYISWYITFSPPVLQVCWAEKHYSSWSRLSHRLCTLIFGIGLRVQSSALMIKHAFPA